MTPPFLPFGNAAIGHASPEAPLGQAGKEGAPADGDPLVGGAGAPSPFQRSETMNVIPFHKDDNWTESDYCSKAGAEALKEKLEAYWRERGFEVMIVIRDAGFHPSIRAGRFDVRSDLVNGLPRPMPAQVSNETEAA